MLLLKHINQTEIETDLTIQYDTDYKSPDDDYYAIGDEAFKSKMQMGQKIIEQGIHVQSIDENDTTLKMINDYNNNENRNKLLICQYNNSLLKLYSSEADASIVFELGVGLTNDILSKANEKLKILTNKQDKSKSISHDAIIVDEKEEHVFMMIERKSGEIVQSFFKNLRRILSVEHEDFKINRDTNGKITHLHTCGRAWDSQKWNAMISFLECVKSSHEYLVPTVFTQAGAFSIIHVQATSDKKSTELAVKNHKKPVNLIKILLFCIIQCKKLQHPYKIDLQDTEKMYVWYFLSLHIS